MAKPLLRLFWMQLLDLFVVIPVGFLYPSFNLYVKVAKKQNYDRELIHFIVISLFFSFFYVIGGLFGGFFLVTLPKLLMLFFLVIGEYGGSILVYNKFVVPILGSSPFLVDFADSSQKSSLSQMIQKLFSYIFSSFSRRYSRILCEVDSN